MDMRLMRCWASAQHNIRYSILLFLRHEDLGRQVKNISTTVFSEPWPPWEVFFFHFFLPRVVNVDISVSQ